MKNNKFSLLGTFLFVLLVLSVASCRVAEEGTYDTWDADKNAMLDTNEFGTAWEESGYFERWDANKDNIIDESEWSAGRNSFMTDYDESAFGTFSDWDDNADGGLAESEFRDGVFEVYDVDDDGFWADNEYGTWWGTFSGGL